MFQGRALFPWRGEARGRGQRGGRPRIKPPARPLGAFDLQSSSCSHGLLREARRPGADRRSPARGRARRHGMPARPGARPAQQQPVRDPRVRLGGQLRVQAEDGGDAALVLVLHARRRRHRGTVAQDRDVLLPVRAVPRARGQPRQPQERPGARLRQHGPLRAAAERRVAQVVRQQGHRRRHQAARPAGAEPLLLRHPLNQV